MERARKRPVAGGRPGGSVALQTPPDFRIVSRGPRVFSFFFLVVHQTQRVDRLHVIEGKSLPALDPVVTDCIEFYRAVILIWGRWEYQMDSVECSCTV